MRLLGVGQKAFQRGGDEVGPGSVGQFQLSVDSGVLAGGTAESDGFLFHGVCIVTESGYSDDDCWRKDG